ncbi:PASTA domain-containing protein [Pseudonocardia sp. GCM10023141]|uniref:PASTA domain-containing protein n=1 Tax=Pseudonocardia sp. GCM10023141 TaxID=3252653 RepID=UPI00360C52C8
MSTDRDPWRDGREAWEHLAAWYRDRHTAPGDPLGALNDIGLLRRLLDEAELEAVRNARHLRRSWAEIAIKLGVTRQSAWERWRDLDVEPAVGGTRGDPGRAAMPPLDIGPPAAAAVLDRAARAARRRAWVTVPNVVGRSYADAGRLLGELGLVPLSADPQGAPSLAFDEPGPTVTDQSPESGARAQPGAPVTLWTERGGGAGVREPRRPKPTPHTGRKVLEEPSQEAVS